MHIVKPFMAKCCLCNSLVHVAGVECLGPVFMVVSLPLCLLWHYGIDYMSGFCLVFYFYPWEWLVVLRELQFLTCREVGQPGYMLYYCYCCCCCCCCCCCYHCLLYPLESGYSNSLFSQIKLLYLWKKINGLKYMILWYTNLSSFVLFDCKNWTMSYWMHEETWNKIQFFVTE